MARPKQVVPLLLAGVAAWLAHLVLAVTTADAAAQMSSPVLGAAMVSITFWLGVLLLAAALLLLVLTWDRRARDTPQQHAPAGADHYA